MELKVNNLENCFSAAKDGGFKFVGVLIEMEGFPRPEVIINERDNFDSKLEYYKKTYDENLNHRFAKGIKIVGFTFGIDFRDIEHDLIAKLSS